MRIDTMGYTALALLFMFQNLGKTVILTGSQVPMIEQVCILCIYNYYFTHFFCYFFRETM